MEWLHTTHSSCASLSTRSSLIVFMCDQNKASRWLAGHILLCVCRKTIASGEMFSSIVISSNVAKIIKKYLIKPLLHQTLLHTRSSLTFPIVTILRHEEVVTHLFGRHTLHYMTCLQWIHYHAVNFFLASIHFHFTFVGEQLPTVAILTDTLSRIVQLLCADLINLIKRNICIF